MHYEKEMVSFSYDDSVDTDDDGIAGTGKWFYVEQKEGRVKSGIDGAFGKKHEIEDFENDISFREA